MKKIQVPVVGGLRKTVTVLESGDEGTTIQGLAGQTVTLAQLAALVAPYVTNSSSSSTAGGNIGGGNGNSIALGPGLSGGGALVGAVPINLIAPIPAWIFEDGDDGGGVSAPGAAGAPGINGVGAPGPAGPAIYLNAEDGEDGMWAIPGKAGTNGTNGVGSPGPAGAPVWPMVEDGEDGMWGPPGAAGAAGTGSTIVRGAVFSGGGSAVVAPTADVSLVIPAAGTIQKVVVLTTGGPGSAVIDIRKTSYASFPTATSICASALPTLSSATEYQDSTLTGWTTALAANDILLFHLSSASTFTSITISVYIH